MELNEKIRSLRESNHWSQEEMAEKLNISKTGYAKIERGEVRLNLDRLTQIANIFSIDIADLIKKDNGSMIFIIDNKNGNDHGHGTVNYYNSMAGIAAENEKLKLIIFYKEELITQLKQEIEILRELVSLQKRIQKD